MDTRTVDVAAYEKILEEHRTLKGLLGQIEQALGQRTASIDEVSHLLAQFGDQLVKHFALEEEGSYFSELMLRAPQLVARANALMAQHPKICTQVRDLVVDLKLDQSPSDWWEETSRRFDAFKAELLRHESGENGLLQEAYTQDLGAHD